MPDAIGGIVGRTTERAARFTAVANKGLKTSEAIRNNSHHGKLASGKWQAAREKNKRVPTNLKEYLKSINSHQNPQTSNRRSNIEIFDNRKHPTPLSSRDETN